MVLAEVIIESRNIKQKIKQLESYLDKITEDSDKVDLATAKLIDLFDKYRSHLILINTINNDVKMVVGDSEVSIANTLLIINTMKRKINLLDNLIDTKYSFLDVFDLNHFYKMIAPHFVFLFYLSHPLNSFWQMLNLL